MLNKLLLLALLFFSAVSFAADNTDLYTFTSLTHKQRFYDLTSEFRCLVCQNQTLAESNAPFAKDMRKQILMMINQDASDQEIREFLVKRYGEFVRYKPPFNPATYFLWLAPGILLLIGVSFLLSRR